MGVTAESDLIARWPLNEESASDTVVDSTGGGATGTPTALAGGNKPTPVADVPSAISSLVRCRSFSQDGYIRVGYQSQLDIGSGDFFLCGWVRVVTVDDFYSLARVDSNGSWFAAWVRTTLKFQSDFDDGTNLTRPTGGSEMDDDAWHWVATAKSGSTGYAIVDDTVVGSADVGDSGNGDFYQDNQDFILGAGAGGNFPLKGKMSDWRLYDKFLSSSERAAIYAGDLDAGTTYDPLTGRALNDPLQGGLVV